MADLTVCGIPLEHFAEDLERYVADGGVTIRLHMKCQPGPTWPASWECEFYGLEVNQCFRFEGSADEAAKTLELAVLKDFGHKLALMRWLLEQT